MPPNTPISLAYVLDHAPGHGVTCRAYRPVPSTVPGRRPFKPIDPGKFLRSPEIRSVEPWDRQLLMRLGMNQSTAHATGVALYGTAGSEIVRKTVDTGRCYWTREGKRPLEWGEERSGIPEWAPCRDGLHRPVLQLVPEGAVCLPVVPPVYVDEAAGACGPIRTEIPGDAAAEWANGSVMETEEAARFAMDMTARYEDCQFPFPPSVRVERVEGVAPVPCITLSLKTFMSAYASRETGLSQQVPFVRVEFGYDDARIQPSSRRETVCRLSGRTVRCIARRPEQEKAWLAGLKEHGLVPLEEVYRQHDFRGQGDCWGLPEDGEKDWGDLLHTVLPALEQDGWVVDRDPRFKVIPVGDDVWYSELESSGTNWFDLEAGFVVDGSKVNLLPVVHNLLHGSRDRSIEEIVSGLEERSVTLPIGQGRVCVVPGRRLAVIVRNLFELFDSEPLSRDRRLRVSTWRAAEIVELESFSASPWNAPDTVRTLADRLRAGVSLSPQAPPDGFRGTLRKYQQIGLAWLRFLSANEFDGILADDMGLGKTVQALAHLLHEKEEGCLDRPALVVAPTSLMKNWADEAERFTPDLRVLVLHGADRKEHFDQVDEVDLVLTTYALLRWDADVYRDREFSYVLLDEAQFIKNHKAQVAQLARALKSRRRLCLTGTPMENHLGELWSLFRFLMPGFLGTHRAFKTHFRVPIEKEGNQALRELLSRRLAPFLLRRTKEQVTPELPPRTEILRPVELSQRQRDLYESVRLAMQSRIRKEVRKKGVARSHIVVLDALLKLRQVCCDPRLLVDEAEVSIPDDSCKLGQLRDMLPEMIEEGRRILLFSQFVKMLKLIEKELRRLRLKYVMLTGSSRNRPALIETFQSGEVPLFLISLKAGGTGLNLTAADTVIHYDPWWNPAVENQATDRAHRIGQTKPVFVYKLLTEGTVESRIQELQQHKKALADGILSNRAGPGLTLEESEIDTLFAPIR